MRPEFKAAGDEVSASAARFTGAVCTYLALLLESRRVERPDVQDSKSPTLITKRALATELSKSIATINRFDREGAPFETVGSTKRYDLAAYRSWLAARGRGPTSRRTPEDDTIDVSRALRGGGLRVAGRSR